MPNYIKNLFSDKKDGKIDTKFLANSFCKFSKIQGISNEHLVNIKSCAFDACRKMRNCLFLALSGETEMKLITLCKIVFPLCRIFLEVFKYKIIV